MHNVRWKESSTGAEIECGSPHSLFAINSLPLQTKRAIYFRLIPSEVIERFGLDLTSENPFLEDLVKLNAEPGCPTVELSLYHEPGFHDPIVQALITDTIHGPLHVLFYAMNDPESPRFDIDRMPDGSQTMLGAASRNLEAEAAALAAGLAPGQIRRGLHLLNSTVAEWEQFVSSLGHEIYFAQPLYYHNAVIFERMGFAYAKGRRLMERIHQGFAPGGEFEPRLDGTSPFRSPEAAGKIRLRSWALHDGLLGEPFSDVTMYKQVGESASINTAPGCTW